MPALMRVSNDSKVRLPFSMAIDTWQTMIKRLPSHASRQVYRRANASPSGASATFSYSLESTR